MPRPRGSSPGGCPTPPSRSRRGATWGAPSVRSPSFAASIAGGPARATWRAGLAGVSGGAGGGGGFAGETEARFEHLLGFVEDGAFDRLGVFTYSVEEGTPAADMPDQVPAEVMAERAQQVQDLQDRLAWPRQKALFGTRQTVLVDGPSPDPAFPFDGRTAGQAPEIDGVVLLRNARLTPGRFADVGIVEVDGYELVGE